MGLSNIGGGKGLIHEMHLMDRGRRDVRIAIPQNHGER